MDRTPKVATGYQITPVTLPVPVTAITRDLVCNLQRGLRRRVLRSILAVRRGWARIVAWAEGEIGRELTAADGRFVGSFAVLAVALGLGSTLLTVAALVWFGLELRSLLRREQKGGQR